MILPMAETRRRMGSRTVSHRRPQTIQQRQICRLHNELAWDENSQLSYAYYRGVCKDTTDAACSTHCPGNDARCGDSQIHSKEIPAIIDKRSAHKEPNKGCVDGGNNVEEDYDNNHDSANGPGFVHNCAVDINFSPKRN